jgi:phosphatidylserine decarboxylase
MSVVDRLPIPRPSLPTPSLPLAPGALENAGLLAIAAVPVSLVIPFLGVPLLLGAAFVLYFYRDPARHPPASGYLAPADGTVTVVEYDEDQPDRVRVGIYLSPTDVHVIRSPLGSRVRSVRHSSGGHWPAFTKRSERNERVHVDFDGTDVTMIAGAVARRITPYVEDGQELRRGERIGHIAFGSRTDVLLPEGVEPADLAVKPGESVTAGESVLVAADVVDPRRRRDEGSGSERDSDPGSDGGEAAGTGPESPGGDPDEKAEDAEDETGGSRA